MWKMSLKHGFIRFVSESTSSDGIDIFSLKLFGVLAETGSFTRTAESLRLTQSAVSRHLQRLEANVGGRLFERTTHQTGSAH